MRTPAGSPRAATWIERCATELARIDPALDDTDAVDLATEMFRFPRTAAMAPEAAVEFVAHQLKQAAPRFERRRLPR